MTRTIVFILCFYAHILVGQDINLDSVALGYGSLGQKLVVLADKYKDLTNTEGVCSETYKIALKELYFIKNKSVIAINQADLVRVAASMNSLVILQKQQPNCFNDDFKAYYDALNRQTIKLVNEGKFNLPERFKPKMKSNGIWVNLCIALIFIALLIGLNWRKSFVLLVLNSIVQIFTAAKNKEKKRNIEWELTSTLEPISPLEKTKQIGIYGGKSAIKEAFNSQAITPKEEKTDNNSVKVSEKAKNTEGEQKTEKNEKDINEAARLAKLEVDLTNVAQLQTQIAQLKDALEAEKRKVEKPNLTNFFYMSSPSQEACFLNSGRTENFMARRSFYRFFVFANGEAHFEFCNDPSTIKWAFERPHTIILMACEEVERRTQEPKEIITLRRGRAIFDAKNDTWLVTLKAEIEYQY
jgi:hypothetical protein